MSLVAHIDPEYHHERKPFFGKFMEEQGLEVEGIGDVRSALEELAKKQYDIVVMNLQQFSGPDDETAPPYSNGIVFIEEILENPSFGKPPILVHCPQPPRRIYEQLQRLGVEYMRKITQPDIVIAKMQELIGARSAGSDFAGDLI